MFACWAGVPAPLIPELAFTELPPRLQYHISLSSSRAESTCYARRLLIQQNHRGAILQRRMRRAQPSEAAAHNDRSRGRHGCVSCCVPDCDVRYGGYSYRLEEEGGACQTHSQRWRAGALIRANGTRGRARPIPDSSWSTGAVDWRIQVAIGDNLRSYGQLRKVHLIDNACSRNAEASQRDGWNEISQRNNGDIFPTIHQ